MLDIGCGAVWLNEPISRYGPITKIDHAQLERSESVRALAHGEYTQEPASLPRYIAVGATSTKGGDGFGVALTLGAPDLPSDLSQFCRRVADILIIGGWFVWNPPKLAIIPIQRINTLLQQLLLPILSRLNQESERYRYAYLRVIRQLMLFLTPGVVAVGVSAPVLVPFLLGEQWAPAAPIFAWLTLAALHRPVSMSVDLLFISQARMRDYLAWSAFSTFTSVTAFIVGLRWGAVGVAAAFALSDLFVRMPALWWWATRRGPIRMRDLYLSAAPFAAGSATAFVVVSLVQRMTLASDFILLAASAILAYIASWSVVALFKRGRATMGDSMQLIRTELPRLLRRQRIDQTGSG